MLSILMGLALLLWTVLALLVAPILALVLLTRVRKLNDRLAELERRFNAPDATPPVVEAILVEPISAPSPTTVQTPSPPLRSSNAASSSFDLELFLGRKAMGWVAVVLLIFATAFFLRYAFQNNWIGPLGRVAIGLIAGILCALAGWRYHCRGWLIFSRMLTAAGLVLLYLSTYAAFGFYHLLPQAAAAALLLVLIVESALLAVRYDALSLGLVALLGGLLTPILMHSEQDQYQSLFIYLTALNLGVLLLALWRNWAALGTVALLGTQGLFWTWYFGNYHPEKLPWAISFQGILYALFLGHSLAAHVFSARMARLEDLVRLLLTACAWFTAAYVLLRPDFRPWLGSLAVLMAMIYTALARLTFALRADDPRQTLTFLAVAVSFLALALPIQADANWVALGWAAEAAALWWFGLRIRVPVLRGMAAAVGALAVIRLVAVDTPWGLREPFIPLWNDYALPALGTAVCLLGSVIAARRQMERLGLGERPLVPAAGVLGVLLVLLVLSVETYGYFDSQGSIDYENSLRWEWLGQMALSALWGVYASTVLAIGFWRQLTLVRWTALALFALTIAKVFLVDMSDLDEFYRILAFFIVAVLAGAAAWAYQRIQPRPSEPPLPQTPVREPS